MSSDYSLDALDNQESNVKQQKILVVDDLRSSQILIAEVLKTLDVDVLACSSGDEALTILKQHDISLILLDVVMPKMDGYELAKQIRELPGTQLIPIIFVTGSQQSHEQLLLSYRSGVVDILTKPLQAEIVQAKAKIFLELDKQRRLIDKQSQDLKAAFKQLQHYAQHDQLTQLYNREQMTNILVRLMANARRTHRLIGVLFIDLDHFKNVNDTLGHDVGDRLLRSVAERIKSVVREGDFVARLGGDEFAIILNDFKRPEDAGEVAQKILLELTQPHYIYQHELIISCSIGIALYDNHSNSAADLLKSADVAMYQAKRKGRSQYAYFSQGLEEKALRKVELAQGLNEAIENDELSICYQPQVDAQDQTILGFEALLRWYKDGEFISPAEFIPVAEESGLIPKLGEWVLLHSCLDLKAWQEQGLVDEKIKVAVNISNRQIQAADFLDVLDRVLKQSSLAPHCLELELTESTIMDDPESAISIFNSIHELGIEIAVDDFGTGYSSLSYLRQLPLDCLKIDQSFVREVCMDQNDEAIVKAIISLSHNLGMKVIAEGVETESQSLFLKDNDCDSLQGYLFSKPMPALDVPSFIEQQKTSV